MAILVKTPPLVPPRPLPAGVRAGRAAVLDALGTTAWLNATASSLAKPFTPCVRRPNATREVPIRRPVRPLTKNEPRINDRIRKSPVRLIDDDGAQLGIVPLEEAKARALEKNLDLVEVGGGADPPVVKIMNWGKVKFERDKKARESKKKATVIDVKEVKFRPTIGENDFNIKLDRALRFLKKGKKVKVTVFFRYRQLRRPELGVQILDKVTEETAEMADVETRSKLEGRMMTMILSPKASSATAAAAAAASPAASNAES